MRGRWLLVLALAWCAAPWAMAQHTTAAIAQVDARAEIAAALTSYRKGLDIREALTGRDPVNVQWQIDVAVSCSKLGTHAVLAPQERRTYLQHGLQIQKDLMAQRRLPPNQDWIAWFEEQLKELNAD